MWRIILETDRVLRFPADLDIAIILDRTVFILDVKLSIFCFQDFGFQILKALRSREVG